jgi:flagellar biosynthesis protein FlhA
MPTKNMAIEAEYNAGAITEEEARARKRDVQREADFYGAMDGASKFVSGNVKIGIFITVVNLVAGLVFGMVFRGEPFAQAIGTYASFTIGDGLLSQLPALFVSVATGLIVTRSVSDGTFGADIKNQFSQNAKVYYVGGGTLIVIAFLPGFPWYILLPLGGVFIWLGRRLQSAESATFKKKLEKANRRKKTRPRKVPLT